MAVAQVVAIEVNPNDPTQWVVLWGNGRIDSHNCPQITDGPNGWYTRVDQPVAVAIHVYDWVEMKGYVFDKQGGFHPFGGANLLSLGGDNGAEVVGVPYWYEGIYVDWSWDPFHPGRGIALDGYGTLHAFGGAPDNVFRPGYRWTALVACKLVMSWGPVDMRAYTLDVFGGIHPDYSAVPAGAGAPYWPGWAAAKDLAIANWATGAGWTLDLFGGVTAWGGAEPAIGGPYLPGADRARRLAVLNGDDPLEFLEVWAFGQEYQWKASTRPTVIAGGTVPLNPPSTVTTTTRPLLSWAMTDAERDSQAEWELFVFTQAYVTANPGAASDPWAHLEAAVVSVTGKDPLTRGVRSPVHLANGNYVEVVRVKDTSELWSLWGTRSWSQDVTLPAAPTGLVATPSEDTYSVGLSVSTSSGLANLVRFEFSDDGELTWSPVRGGEAIPRTATTVGTDWDIPLRPGRRFRAVVYANDPAIASPPSNVQPASLRARTYVLTSTADPTLGGEVIAVGAMGWTERSAAGVFETLGDKFPVVLSDGEPKARRQELTLDLNGRTEFEKIKALVRSNSVLLLRDPFGEAVYCRIVGDISQEQQREEPLPGEDTPLRHSHQIVLPLVEVEPPTEIS